VLRTFVASSSGHISRFDARVVGEVSVALGAGRAAVHDSVDPGVGIVLRVKVGGAVEAGDALADVHAANTEAAERAVAELAGAVDIVPDRVTRRALILERMEHKDAVSPAKPTAVVHD
ncbi:MAG: hypothetical protein MUE60_01355, partial [Candidatus Eisenbacteria bacterium]|jgi:thymidine phosphorylase|nr:hypothetical protein [Candidatus Eisenbacteria bacterium]